MNLIPGIFPVPQNFKIFGGALARPDSFSYSIDDDFKKASWFFQKEFDQQLGIQSTTLTISKFNHHCPEAYCLKVKPSGISLRANEAVGIFRGLNTLLQILHSPSCKEFIPCLEIEDSPILKKRGFMLDLSRCKVPTMNSLFELIDLLASLHYNEFQLYVEHTFAFTNHDTVWKDSSPLTGEEVRIIDKYCTDRFIELIPNLNSFGHFERWLRHDTYRHLAECPDGFCRETPYMHRDHGSTLKPNQESLDFINSLYQEYLPHFTSEQFNVGMDEPWELGQGWSQYEVKRRGRDQVYLSHLEGIRKLVEKNGRTMQFWADVLLENPENAKLLPNSASPIIWGYEADHPFNEQARAISSSGLSFRLAPGTATWRSFSGRWNTAQANLKSAVDSARIHQAEGILLTSWGDCGNHQPWSTFYPPLFFAAQLAWTGREIESKELYSAIDRKSFGGEESGYAQWICDFGLLDSIIESEIPNTSLSWDLLFNPRPKIRNEFLRKKISKKNLEAGLEYLVNLEERLCMLSHFSDLEKVKEELSIGLGLSKFALLKGLSIVSDSDQTVDDKNDLVARFASSWLARARPGGLMESKELLEHALLTHDSPL